MIPEAIFFPASGRSMEQSTRYRKYVTQPKPDSQKGFINSIPDFLRIVDLTLAPENSYSTPGLLGHGLILLLPIVGTLKIEWQTESVYLDPGQMATFETNFNHPLVYSNPLEGDLVNFLEIWLAHGNILTPGFQIYPVDIENTNALTSTQVNRRLTVSVGKFQGRQSADLTLIPDAGAFVYVINGAFEVANRLMEAGDGLGIFGMTGTVDFEALAEESILVVLK